jgi:hypothetical protein
VVRTGAKRSGPEQTGTHSPLSGPRYRGSNPCLPASLRSPAGETPPRRATAGKPASHLLPASTPTGEGCLAVAAAGARATEGEPRRRTTDAGFEPASNPAARKLRSPSPLLANHSVKCQGSTARAVQRRQVMQGVGKRFVYVLRSDSDPDRHYVGITSDPDRRLEWHNHGPCGHTTGHRPWTPSSCSNSRPSSRPSASRST